jgi:drug/metabolite transporter (DMT)-like permease
VRSSRLVGTDSWEAVTFYAVFATAFGFAGWQWGFSRIGPNKALIYQYLTTGVGLASGIVFSAERLGFK